MFPCQNNIRECLFICIAHFYICKYKWILITRLNSAHISRNIKQKTLGKLASVTELWNVNPGSWNEYFTGWKIARNKSKVWKSFLQWHGTALVALDQQTITYNSGTWKKSHS
jgi:hypothetical protein